MKPMAVNNHLIFNSQTTGIKITLLNCFSGHKEERGIFKKVNEHIYCNLKILNY